MKLSTVQIERFSKQYTDSNITMLDLERLWGHPSGTLYRWGFELGLKRPKAKKGQSVAIDYVRQYCEALSKELPAFKIPMMHQVLPMGHGRTMDVVLLLSDLHTGRLTTSFNSSVFALRMEALAWRVCEAIRMLRECYNVQRLRIFAIGDFVSGESIGRNIEIEELETVLLKQVYKIAIPALTSFTIKVGNYVDEVAVDTVRGNHGMTARPTVSKITNWDNVVYLGWQARMAAVQMSIEFDVEIDSWYKYVDVQGKMHLLVHGDQIRGGSPYNSAAVKVRTWRGTLPMPFDYCDMGHFHHFNMICNTFINATLLTDDDWSREVLGRDGDCGQWLLGCTERGVECALPITLGDVV